MNFYFKELDLQLLEVKIEDDQVHHFKNVSRGKVGDVAKVFNGNGLVALAVVDDVTKKSLLLKIQKIQNFERNETLSLILGVPKREYLESIFRTSVQVGLNPLYLIHTKYSPWKFKASSRLDKILISSMLQSENPYLPEVRVLEGFDEIKAIPGKKIAFVTEENEVNTGECEVSSFLIGPEGGFHPRELEVLKSDKNFILSRLSTPIMKAEVAVGYCAGHIQGLAARR